MDDVFFSDDFWEDQCFDGLFGGDYLLSYDGGFLDMDELAHCVEAFAENTYLYIDTDKVLDCSESMEKVAWQSYPSCFELRYYTPYFCEVLYQEFDEVYNCVYDLIRKPPCYLDNMPDGFDGCVINFANSAGLEVENVLSCTVNYLFDELDEKCYSNGNSLDACEAFERCTSVLKGAGYCASDISIDLNDVVAILEQELDVTDFEETIYDGSVDLKEVLFALDEYDGWNYTNKTELNELEWSEFVSCITLEFNSLNHEFCYLKNEVDIIGGCVELFANFFDLNAEALLTCDLDIEEQFKQNCELDQDACFLVEQCRVTVYGINDCVESIFGIAFFDLSAILSGSEFGDILPSLYAGTADLPNAFQRLVDYDGPMSEDSSWENLVLCISQYETWD